jgi:hypothetical protein
MATTFKNALSSNIGATGLEITITDTNQVGNIVTVDSTTGLAVGMELIVLGTTIGNLIAGTYYIITVESSTEITISTSLGGPPFNVGTGNGGNMTGIINKTTSLLTSPSNAKITVVGLALVNCTDDLQVVNVQLVDNANSNTSAYYAYKMIIPQNQVLKLVNGGERMVLGTSTTINVYSYGSGGLDAVVSYVEIV